MPFAQCLWLEVFAVKIVLSHLKKRLNQLPWKPKCVMWSSFGQAFRKKLNSRLLVQEEHGFRKGVQCAPLAAGAKKRLAWIGLILSRPRGHIVPPHLNHSITSKRLWVRSYCFVTLLSRFLSIQTISVPPTSPQVCCHVNHTTFWPILKTRISIVFQVFPPERNFLWDNLLSFGHNNNTLRSLIKANIRTVTMKRFQKTYFAQKWLSTLNQLISARFQSL